MKDQSLNHHVPPLVRTYSGTFLGLSFNLAIIVAAAAGVGILLFSGLYRSRGFWDALMIGFVPPVGVGLFLYWFFQDKPTGYLRDWIESLVNRGHAVPAPDSVPLYTPLPDIQLAGDLIFYGGLDSGSIVARGYQIELPPIGNASNTECNLREDRIRQLLCQTRGYSLHVQWHALADYEVELRRYASETRKCDDPKVRTYRNRTLVSKLADIDTGNIRRERVCLYLCRKVTSAGNDRAEQVRQLRAEFDRLGVELANTLGRVTPMNDADHLREFRRKLNPSWKLTLELDPNSSPTDWWQSELRGGKGSFYLDGYHFASVCLRQWPNGTNPTQFMRFTQLDGVEISVQIDGLGVDKLLAEEQREVNKLKQQLESRPDERVRVALTEKEEKIRRLSAGDLLPLELEYLFLVRGQSEDQLAERVLALKGALHSLPGLQYLELTLPASNRNAFFRSLPGNLSNTGIRIYGEDNFVADLLPFGGSFVGHLATAEAIYSNPQGSIVGIKTFSGEGTAATPQNAVCFGSNGTGKSMFLTDLIRQTQPYYNYWVIIEEGQSQMAVAKSMGIDPIVLRADGNQTINIFETRGLPMSALQESSIVGFVSLCVGLPSEKDQANLRQATISQAVTQLIRDHGLECLRERPDRRKILEEAFQLHELCKKQDISLIEAYHGLKQSTPVPSRESPCTDAQLAELEAKNPSFVAHYVYSKLAPEEQLTLSHLRNFFELNSDERWQQLGTLLGAWCRGGTRGRLWDGPSNVNYLGRGAYLELGMISESDRELKAAALHVASNDLRQHILSLPRHYRKLFVIEELSRLLEIPNSDVLLREIFSQFRKFNVCCLTTLQTYSRIADTPLRPILMGNSRMFFVFNVTDQQDLARLGADIGLSSAAQEQILRYPRPDQMTGQKYSEFTYFHTDVGQPLCGTVRNILLSQDE